MFPTRRHNCKPKGRPGVPGRLHEPAVVGRVTRTATWRAWGRMNFLISMLTRFGLNSRRIISAMSTASVSTSFQLRRQQSPPDARPRHDNQLFPGGGRSWLRRQNRGPVRRSGEGVAVWPAPASGTPTRMNTSNSFMMIWSMIRFQRWFAAACSSKTRVGWFKGMCGPAPVSASEIPALRR